MNTLLVALAAIAFQGQAATPAWTWALYEGDGVTLAHEVPDTPRLSATFECQPGSSIARLTRYGGVKEASGMVRLSAGSSSAMTEVSAGPRGASVLTVRTDHPVFAAFVADGKLNIQAETIEVEPAHLAKLRRFAELCSG